VKETKKENQTKRQEIRFCSPSLGLLEGCVTSCPLLYVIEYPEKKCTFASHAKQ
jgi:hypothetical protein